MPKSDEIASTEEQGEAESGSVFDFLYHDHRRIASFLSQFDVNGLLTGLTQGEGVTKGAKRSKRLGVGAQAPLVGGGSLDFEIGPGEAGSQTLERIYDPFWVNARQFLDVLTERDMIQRDISAANMGEFVLAKGFLSVLDLVMFKEAWKLPSLQRMIKAGMGLEKPMGNMTAVQKAAAKEQKTQ
ncbi:MAG: hypothetical protein H5U21_08725, partial [Porphyrobacter sp.]|nr:hypothetical protein [Porphyrobacter sp.]